MTSSSVSPWEGKTCGGLRAHGRLQSCWQTDTKGMRDSCSHRPSPFPSRNGRSSATPGHVELGVREIPIGKGALFQPRFGPASPAQLCLLLLLWLLLCPPAPEKTRGHGPAPVTARVVPSPLRFPVLVPVPVPVPVEAADVLTISIGPFLQKLSTDYLIVEWHAQCQHP
jgi:hypothetical protein